MPSAVRTRDSDPFRSSDPYAGDDFRMYEFKVRRCVRGRTHDWTDCPFAHPGEKACRRDPRRFHYSGNACPDFRRGACRRGDACELAHGVFESWLHPARYRTQPCRDGRSCRRKVCFFAHTPAQLRVLPSPTSPPTGSSSSSPASGKQRSLICSCAFCPCKSPVSSPNSTLNMGLSHFSPPVSPPLSPVYSPSLDCDSAYRNVFNYKSLLTELVNSLEAMDLSSVVSPSASSTATVDAFLLSPASSVSRDYSTNYQEKDDINAEESSFSNNINGCPDLDWVNELVM